MEVGFGRGTRGFVVAPFVTGGANLPFTSGGNGSLPGSRPGVDEVPGTGGFVDEVLGSSEKLF